MDATEARAALVMLAKWRRQLGMPPQAEGITKAGGADPVIAAAVDELHRGLKQQHGRLQQVAAEFEKQQQILRESPAFHRLVQSAEMLRAGDTLGLIKSVHESPQRPNWLVCR